MQISHFTPSFYKAKQVFKPTTIQNANSKWGYIERTFKFNDIPNFLKNLGNVVTTDVKILLSRGNLPKNLEPEILLQLPDNMPYRGFTPIRSIENRLKDAENRIKNTLYHGDETSQVPNNDTFIKNFSGYVKDKLNLKLPNNYVEKLSNPNKLERDEALREYLFDNPKTASALFNLPYKRVTVDVARLQALKSAVDHNPQIKKYYPNIIDTFNQMLSSNIILRYLEVIGTDTSLFNKDLLKDSFKFGVKFFVPPTPGIIDSTAIAIATSQNYVRGINKFIKTVEQVNSLDFLSRINAKQAYTILPKKAETVLERIGTKLKSPENKDLKNKEILLRYYEKFYQDFSKSKSGSLLG